MVIAGLVVSALPANAQIDPGVIDVIEVNGLIDPVLTEFIHDSLDNALEFGSDGVVLQMESGGAAIDDDELRELVTRIANFEIPVSVWLGPANTGEALGGAGQIALASSALGLAPGTEIGNFGPSVLPPNAANGALATLLAGGFEGEVVGYDDLVLDALVEDPTLPILDAPVVLNHLLQLDNFESSVLQAGDTLPDGRVLPDDADATQVPVSGTRFVTLPLLDQQFHTFASPAVAYLIFIIGLGLLVFELYTAGVGVAGVIGAGCLLAGGYGLDVLDARWWAVVLLVVAFVGFAIDVQSGIQAFWSTVGVIALIVGSLFLFADHSIGWLPLVVGIVGVLLSMLSGMPAMVRTRFSTPTIGREWMIGEIGEAANEIDPEGVVILRGAPWRARTNRATPIAKGEQARVVEVDGLLLEVEPEVGGAVDYRERRKKDGDAVSDEADGDDVNLEQDGEIEADDASIARGVDA